MSLTGEPTGLSVDRRRMGAWFPALVVLWVMSDFLFPNVRFFYPRFGDCLYAMRHGCVTLPDVLLHVVCLALLGAAVGRYIRGRGRAVILGGATLCLYLLWALVSVLYDYRYRTEVLPVASTAIGAAMCGVACFLLLREHVRTLYNILIVLMTVQGIWAIGLYLTERPDQYFYSGTVHRAGGLFHSPTVLYLLLLGVIPLAFGQGMVSGSRLQKIGSFAASGVMFVALCLTCYRGGMLGLLGALAVLCLIFRRHRSWRRAGLLLLPTVLFFTVLAFCLRVDGPRNAASSARSIGGRLRLFKIGMGMYLQSPIVGNGVGSVRLYLPGDSVANAYQRSWFYPHPHNQLLHWMIEMGAFGALFWLGVQVQIGIALLSRRPDPWRVIAASSLLALSVAWITDASVDVGNSAENTLVFFVLFCALALKDGRSADVARADAPSGTRDAGNEGAFGEPESLG